MKVLLKRALILCKSSSFNNQKKDIFIENGVIINIGDNLKADSDVTLTSANLTISLGWFDIGTHVGEPGLEHKEDLKSAIYAALKGGYSGFATFPNSKPCIQTKEQVQFLLNKAKSYPFTMQVIAAATENLENKSMTEILDLIESGVVAFSDGGNTIQNSGLLIRLLQYLSQTEHLLFVTADDSSISAQGLMNEGEMSVYLGLKGIPSIAEEIVVSRSIALLEYAEGRIHFHKISTEKSVQLIKKAREAGLNVTCGVSVANLCFEDSSLISFDSNFKVIPPLRTKKDIEALWKGLADKTIDIIVSDHTPHDEESKNLELDQAEFGMIQLETAFSILNQNLENRITLEELIEKLSVDPRNLLKITIPKIEVGELVDITIFDPTLEWVYEEKSRKSKSKNNPYMGQVLRGKILAVINKGEFRAFN